MIINKEARYFDNCRQITTPKQTPSILKREISYHI